MTSEIAEVFNELLFGSGFWLGLIFILAVAIGISYKYKYSGILFEVVLFFMGIEYYDNIAVDDNKMWGVILCFLGMIFLIVKMTRDFYDSRS